MLPLSAVQMTAALQAHLRAAGLPTHSTMHSFRVCGSVSQSLVGTPVDEIMRLGGWESEVMEKKHYTGATTSGPERTEPMSLGEMYDLVNAWSASSDFRDQ